MKYKSWTNPTHFLDAIDDEWYQLLIDLQSEITWLTNSFFFKNEFKTLHLPVTTNSISSPMGLGSDSRPVKIELFGNECYLADSMRFMLEYGCRFHPKGVFYLMPSFRGESADESHLCQFYHSEAEIKGNLNDVMLLVESYLKYLSDNIVKKLGENILRFTGDDSHFNVLSKEIPRIRMAEVITDFKKHSQYLKFNEEGRFHSLTREGERKLIQECNGAVWVTHFEFVSTPFYQAFDDNPAYSKSADLLVGMGETVGAGERHSDIEDLMESLRLHEVNSADYQWYIDLKKHKPLKTSGFGLGTERYLCWLLKSNDIRTCQLIPRFNGCDNIP